MKGWQDMEKYRGLYFGIATSLFGNFNLRNREVSERGKNKLNRNMKRKRRERDKEISLGRGVYMMHPGRAGDGIDMSRWIT